MSVRSPLPAPPTSLLSVVLTVWNKEGRFRLPLVPTVVSAVARASLFDLDLLPLRVSSRALPDNVCAPPEMDRASGGSGDGGLRLRLRRRRAVAPTATDDDMPHPKPISLLPRRVAADCMGVGTCVFVVVCVVVLDALEARAGKGAVCGSGWLPVGFIFVSKSRTRTALVFIVSSNMPSVAIISDNIRMR